VGAVKDHLIACVGVDGAHDAALDGSVIVEGLCHRSKAVGGAGGGGDDLILSGEGVLVYAVNDGLEVVSGGSGNNNLLGARVNVSHALIFGAVEARALENNVYAYLAPGKLGGVGLCIYGENFAVYGDGAGFVVG